MAYSPVSPFGNEPSHTPGIRITELTGHDDDLRMPQFSNPLAACEDAPLSAEIAPLIGKAPKLDGALHDLLRQACVATAATGGAIALLCGGEMVCRARTGDAAPGLGIRLDRHSTSSAACLRTRNWQRCDDTRADPQVDAELYRRLGVRSILAVPIMQEQEMLGILEVLSPLPHAFRDRDSRVLQIFSQRVIGKLGFTPQMEVRGTKANSVPEPQKLEGSETKAHADSQAEREAPGKIRLPNFLTNAAFVNILLISMIIVLSLTFGWMLGRAEMRAHKAKSRKPHANVSQSPARTSIPTSSSNTSVGANSFTNIEVNPKPTDGDDITDGSLVISSKGKVIFRLPPTNK